MRLWVLGSKWGILTLCYLGTRRKGGRPVASSSSGGLQNFLLNMGLIDMGTPFTLYMVQWLIWS